MCYNFIKDLMITCGPVDNKRRKEEETVNNLHRSIMTKDRSNCPTRELGWWDALERKKWTNYFNETMGRLGHNKPQWVLNSIQKVITAWKIMDQKEVDRTIREPPPTNEWDRCGYDFPSIQKVLDTIHSSLNDREIEFWKASGYFKYMCYKRGE